MTTTKRTQHLVLPWPPSKNRLHRTILRGKYPTIILSQPAREYYAAVKHNTRHVDSMGSSRLAVTIYLHAPTRRSIDIDGRVAVLLDALESAGVFDNDSQIDELHVYRGDIIKGGKAVVKLEVIECQE